MTYPSHVFSAFSIALTLLCAQSAIASNGQDERMPGLSDTTDAAPRPRHGMRLPPILKKNQTTPALPQTSQAAKPALLDDLSTCSSPSAASTHAATPKHPENWAEFPTEKSQTLGSENPWGSIRTDVSETLSPSSHGSTVGSPRPNPNTMSTTAVSVNTAYASSSHGSFVQNTTDDMRKS